MESPLTQHPTLSHRGQEAAKVGKVILGWKSTMRDTYDPVTNPEGLVNIGVAENTLMYTELASYYESKFSLIPMDFTYGDGLSGTYRLYGALSYFFNKYFKPHKPVVADHLITGSGVTSVLNQLFRAIANPGDRVLIAAPYYPGFDNDLAVMNDVVPVPVPIPESDMFTYRELEYLENALEAETRSGSQVSTVILCNPHNPLGRCYDPAIVLAYAKFCQKHNLHFVCDEIYAFSVFPTKEQPNPQTFSSALVIDCTQEGIDQSRVHVLYGMSKDFNANGFRIGVLVSQDNPLLLQSISVTSLFMIVSSPANSLWSALLRDEEYLPKYLSNNQSMLQEAYEFMTDWLNFHCLPYIKSNAGHFIMVDLRKHLSDVEKYGEMLSIDDGMSMQDREQALITYLLSKKAVITGGTLCHFAEGGWFRLTFTIRRDFLRVALKRIEDALGWDSWSPETSVTSESPVNSTVATLTKTIKRFLNIT